MIVAKLGSVTACIWCACRSTLDGAVRGGKSDCAERMAPGCGTEAAFLRLRSPFSAGVSSWLLDLLRLGAASAVQCKDPEASPSKQIVHSCSQIWLEL